MKFTQKQKILAVMCREPNKWFYPYEFMRSDLGDYFVGYKAPTRIAEMDKDYPGLFEQKVDGKYVMRKLNLANLSIVLWSLPKDLRYIVHRSGIDKGIEQPLDPKYKVLEWGQG